MRYVVDFPLNDMFTGFVETVIAETQLDWQRDASKVHLHTVECKIHQVVPGATNSAFFPSLYYTQLLTYFPGIHLPISCLVSIQT